VNAHDAAQLLTQAITNARELATLRTAPTPQQREAMRCVQLGDVAPTEVCDEVGLERGSTWRSVLRDVAEDVVSELLEP
jgi:hypothetical protein